MHIVYHIFINISINRLEFSSHFDNQFVRFQQLLCEQIFITQECVQLRLFQKKDIRFVPIQRRKKDCIGSFLIMALLKLLSLVRVFLLCLIIFMLNLREWATVVSRENPQGVFFFLGQPQIEPKKKPNPRNRFSSVISKIITKNKIIALKLAKSPRGWGFYFCQSRSKNRTKTPAPWGFS